MTLQCLNCNFCCIKAPRLDSVSSVEAQQLLRAPDRVMMSDVGASQSVSSEWPQLPDELLEKVLEFIPGANELSAMHQVCKAWSLIPPAQDYLDLSTVKGMSDDKLLSLLKMVRLKKYSVTRINLSGCQVTDVGLGLLHRSFPFLRLLNVVNCSKVTSGGINIFKRSRPLVTVKFTPTYDRDFLKMIDDALELERNRGRLRLAQAIAELYIQHPS